MLRRTVCVVVRTATFCLPGDTALRFCFTEQLKMHRRPQESRRCGLVAALAVGLVAVLGVGVRPAAAITYHTDLTVGAGSAAGATETHENIGTPLRQLAILSDRDLSCSTALVRRTGSKTTMPASSLIRWGPI